MSNIPLVAAAATVVVVDDDACNLRLLLFLVVLEEMIGDLVAILVNVFDVVVLEAIAKRIKSRIWHNCLLWILNEDEGLVMMLVLNVDLWLLFLLDEDGDRYNMDDDEYDSFNVWQYEWQLLLTARSIIVEATLFDECLVFLFIGRFLLSIRCSHSLSIDDQWLMFAGQPEILFEWMVIVGRKEGKSDDLINQSGLKLKGTERTRASRWWIAHTKREK